jgi:hypothetical protein
MKKLFLLLPFCWLFSFTYSDAQATRNVRIDADEEKIIIVYDLIATGAVRTYNVCLKTDNASIKPVSTTGAIGKNRPTGINQKIEWFYTSDGYTAEQVSNLKIEIVAIDPNKPQSISNLPKPNKIPIYAGLGTVTLAGAGLMVAGFTKRSDALESYDIYKNNTSNAAPIYSELGVTRDELYEDANKTNKKSQLMIYGGAAVFAAAGYILVNRVIWLQRIENRRSSQVRPADLQCNNFRRYFELKTTTTASAGIGFTYHF